MKQETNWREAQRQKQLIETAGKAALRIETPRFDSQGLEQAILGAALVDPDIPNIIFQLISDDCFQDEANLLVWQAITAIKNKAGRIDLITVSQILTAHGTLEKIGGPYYLVELTNRVCSAANTEYHCQVLLDIALRRNLNRAAFEIIKEAKDGMIDPHQLLQSAKGKINDAETKREKSLAADFDLEAFVEGSLGGLKETGLDVAKILGESVRAKFGLLGQNQLTVVAARPGGGKTAFGVQAALEAAQSGLNTVFLSYEMTAQDVYMRAICIIAEVQDEDWRLGRLNESEKARIKAATARVKALPFKIVDFCGQDVNALVYKVKEMHRSSPINFLAIDYLGMIPRAQGEFFGSTNDQIAYNSAKIRDLTKHLNCQTLLLVQMNRASDKEKNRLPVLSDLRDSGAIEQDAHRVVFIHRHEYFGIPEFEQTECTEEGESTAGKALLVVRKNRGGRIGIAKTAFIGKYTKFAPVESFDFDSVQAAAPQAEKASVFKAAYRADDVNDEFEDLPF